MFNDDSFNNSFLYRNEYNNNSFIFNDLDNLNYELSNEKNLFFVDFETPMRKNENVQQNGESLPSDINNNKINHDEGDFTKRSTISKTDNRLECLIKKKEKIFYIEKTRRLGRHKKDQIYNKNESTHTKDKSDNIKTKVKRNAKNNCVDLVNIALSKSNNKKLNGIRLKKVKNPLVIAYKKEENEKLLKLSVEELLSSEISDKYKTLPKDYNKKQIEKIKKENDEELNSILKKNFLEMIELYTNKIREDNIFKYFRRIDKDLEEFRNEGVDEEYIKLYTTIANEFEDNIKKIFPRKQRKKKLD